VLLIKKPISATIDEDLIKWVNEKLKDKTKFRNKSHLIEIALEKLRKELK
jgi:Arc/MetJ-type ribon-helix-helix transcriptional regulator